MIIAIIKTVQLAATIIIASQGLFYLLAAARAFKTLSINSFAEQRKAIDNVIVKPLQVLYYTALGANAAMLILQGGSVSSFVFAGTLASALLVLADVLIALKCNVPINRQFASYPAGTGIVNWAALQAAWLKYIVIRGVLSSLALAILLLVTIAG